jgi:hypothetical protein
MRLKDGFEPFPELCRFSLALLPALPRLFGYQSTIAADESCQCDGADACVRRVRWEATGEQERLTDQERYRSQMAEARLEGLQSTLRDLIFGQGVEYLLPRIVAAAARAVQASSYVLSIVDPTTAQRHMYCDGIDPQDTPPYIELANSEGELEPNVLAVKVASERRDYGYLVAIRPRDGCFFPQDVSSLEAYSKLAAVALDSASAVDDARRQASTATALLNLSNALVHSKGIGDLAERLVRAVPMVIDCDRAIVTLVDPTGTTAHPFAMFGYETEIEARLRDSDIGTRVESTNGRPLLSNSKQRWVRSDGNPPAREWVDPHRQLSHQDGRRVLGLDHGGRDRASRAPAIFRRSGVEAPGFGGPGSNRHHQRAAR